MTHSLRDDAGAADGRIDELRRRIDELDEQILQMLNARAICAVEIGRIKRVLGVEVYQPSRELDVLNHVRSRNPGPLGPDAVTRLFERIIDENRRMERLADVGEHGES